MGLTSYSPAASSIYYVMGRIKSIGTRPATLLRKQIPVRTEHWDVSTPGFIEADTVAHCGQSMAGEFCWSLTATGAGQDGPNYVVTPAASWRNGKVGHSRDFCNHPSGPSTNLSALGKHVLGNQSNGQCDQSRNNDQIIQMSQDGDKIRN